MNRREFCQRLSITAGAVALTPIINACSQQATQSVTPGSQEELGLLPPQGSPYTATDSPILPTATPTQPPLLPTQVAVEQAPTATMMPAAEVHTTKVALIRTTDRATGVRQAMDLLNINPVSGRPVLLKPNFNSADPAPGSTDNDLLRTLAEPIWGH